MSVYLAVDGGGTKTHCVLFKDGEAQFELLHFGSLNHERLEGGFEELKVRLQLIFDEIKEKYAYSAADIKDSVWGLAGLDTKTQYALISQMLKDLGLENFLICNDAYLGIKAGTSSGVGICLVNGTGYNILGVNEQSEMFQVGSLFELTDDHGGGYILGRKAVSSSYRNLYFKNERTILTEKVMQTLGISERDDFTDAVMRRVAEGEHRISELAKLIFDAANDGDSEALEILRRMCYEYASAVRVLTENLPFEDKNVEVILIGSLFTKQWNPNVLVFLKQYLQELCPSYQFDVKFLHEAPVIGALLWLAQRNALNKETTTSIRKELHSKI